MFFRRKPSLTKEQQDNVVRCIVRGYAPITSVEFTQFSKDPKTGTFLLSFELNGNTNLRTTVFFNRIEELNTSVGIYGLNPVSRFAHLSRSSLLAEDADVSLDAIKIAYL